MLSLYCSAKFALEGFSEALSFELSSLGIGVKLVEPGGVSTNFYTSSGKNFADRVSIPEYDPFVNAVLGMFGKLQHQVLSTPAEVATTIYEAATDGIDKLRYPIGNEDLKRRLAERAALPDQAYLDVIKQGYLPLSDGA